MCGIFAHYILDNNNPSDLGEIKNLVKSRGPNYFESIVLTIGESKLEIFASVLHMRGLETAKQPVRSPSTGNILCWNGEIYSGQLFQVDEQIGDTLSLFSSLESNLIHLLDDVDLQVSRIISSIRGPFAFVFYHHSSRTLYFGRDRMGRRSLLISHTDSDLIVCSVANIHLQNVQEVSTGGLWKINFDQSLDIELIPWADQCFVPFELASLSSVDCDVQSLMQQFKSQMIQSLKERLATFATSNIRSVAVLFSGGLDCTIIARLLCILLIDSDLFRVDTIDLLNVSFENPRVLNARNVKSAPSPPFEDDYIYNVPDRLTGRQSYNELISLLPAVTKKSLTVNFVEINVPYDEYLQQRKHILNLMYPNQTVMDLSIAMAFWFAASGRGLLSKSRQPYLCESRILFSGLGADELFGGYSHHRSSFLKEFDGSSAGGDVGKALESLRASLSMDLRRLPNRNCARDDRLFSDHGKEVRLPFLQEDLINFVTRNVPIDLRSKYIDSEGCESPKGRGEKWFLREFARSIGLDSVAVEPKRAVQFGAKTAKMSKNERGDDLIDYSALS